MKIGETSFLMKAKQFLLLGLEHIFTGYDHILFVISLLFGSRTVRHILSLVTAFTIAHSLTLVLATFEIISLPSKLVESAIALSIIYVALQNIFNQDSKHHPLIAFGFGLIHGFGFAGILTEMRLDGAHLATSLLFFNVGIELGQIIIVSLVFHLSFTFEKAGMQNGSFRRFLRESLLLGSYGFFREPFNKNHHKVFLCYYRNRPRWGRPSYNEEVSCRSTLGTR
ncbi:HupE/UreJ family protein [Paenibacillus piri]|uniref:HupE/UreJ family protein n=1 Tax=Paenibacillus piri TaxID=2547395 RepID=UPI001FE9A3ED|nr:HupE/UreJ family protein [Paenibacillus piri]